MSPTAGANALVLELFHPGFGSAEGTCVGHLSDDDRAALDRDEKVVAFADIEQFAGFRGYHNASEVVDLSGNATVHFLAPPSRPSLPSPKGEMHPGSSHP